MRDDMYKVIVERPRWGSRMRTRDGRLYRASEDVPSKIGMKHGYEQRKQLNENLAPLKRWLQSQVNRPWSKVYAELCANIDRRNTVQEHIFAHIEQFVEINAQLIDGRIYTAERNWDGSVPIEESHYGVVLYVHPTTGILRPVKRVSYAKQYRAKIARERAEEEKTFRVLSETEQLHCIDGIWYLIEVDTIDAREMQRDAVSGEVVCTITREKQFTEMGEALRARYHRGGVYAKRKRQLSHKELQRYKLKNAGDNPAFLFVRMLVCVRRSEQAMPEARLWARRFRHLYCRKCDVSHTWSRLHQLSFKFRRTLPIPIG
jgi:hypothetical protein